ncbi:class E sortase [Streptomyces sp. NPDC060028]|uniref:class E sortase n=1 Tax=Streptomyces sp. NPDC060028 TaxID=3347041 RepID=UPI00368CF52C
MRDHIPVVVQGRRRRAGRAGAAGVLWGAAELAVTVGVVVLLLVVHQVWWTNRQALAGAHEQVRELEREWTGLPAGPALPSPATDPSPDPSPGPGTVPDPDAGPSRAPSASGEGAPSSARKSPQESAYGVLRIPRLGVVVPIAQGVDKRAVLDKGYAGHYTGSAQPGAEGNFALAGHRNTHGEPFRYINRLRAGDELIVDVRGKRYTYVVGRTLPETTERDTGVIAPVPRSVVKPEYGYSEPGAYITLTTCTPEYTSTYRLVVWGVLKS